MKFKIIATILVVIVLLISIAFGTAIRNSANSVEGDAQTEQVQQ